MGARCDNNQTMIVVAAYSVTSSSESTATVGGVAGAIGLEVTVGVGLTGKVV